MITRLVFAVLTALFCCSISADVTVFSGIDAGAGPGDPRPNSDAAHAAFVAASPLAGRRIIDFEGLPLGILESGPIGFRVDMSSTGQDPGCLGGQGVRVSASATLGYNTTSGGSKDLGFCAGFGLESSMGFTFHSSINSFGAYFTGIGTVAASVTLDFNDGSSQSIPLLGAASGGAAFYGFIDPGKRITFVEINEINVGNSRDIFGIDDMEFTVTPPVAVPTTGPLGSLALLLTLLLIGMVTLSRSEGRRV